MTTDGSGDKEDREDTPEETAEFFIKELFKDDDTTPSNKELT